MRTLKDFEEYGKVIERESEKYELGGSSYNWSELDYDKYKAVSLRHWKNDMVVKMQSTMDDSVHYEVALDDAIYAYFEETEAIEIIWDEVWKFEVLALPVIDLYTDIVDRIIEFVDEPIEKGKEFDALEHFDSGDLVEMSNASYLNMQANRIKELING